ncbi:integral membrane protein [Colletotrichum incanum]|nr:integral membrane protein [Colletotrichum incanum]
MGHYLTFSIGGTIAFITLCQRFYTKIFSLKGLQSDDGLLVSSYTALRVLLLQAANTGLRCCSVHHQRRHITYVAALVFMLCNGFTKLSLLTFYLHLSPQKWFRTAVWCGIVMVSLSTACITILMFFQCNPIRKAFDSTITGGSCLDVHILYMATAVLNIGTDIMLFLLLMPMVLNLRLKMAQKLGAVFMIAICSITVATSIVRLSFLPILLTSRDLPWDSAPANIWTLVIDLEYDPCEPELTASFYRFVEGNLFVICGSMPTVRKFFEHFAPKLIGSSTSLPSQAHVTHWVSHISQRPKRKDEEDVAFTSEVVAPVLRPVALYPSDGTT